jgi:hypothetical protein
MWREVSLPPPWEDGASPKAAQLRANLRAWHSHGEMASRTRGRLEGVTVCRSKALRQFLPGVCPASFERHRSWTARKHVA